MRVGLGGGGGMNFHDESIPETGTHTTSNRKFTIGSLFPVEYTVNSPSLAPSNL